MVRLIISNYELFTILSIEVSLFSILKLNRFDNDFWRMSYYNYVKEKCKIKTPDSLWTFEVIQFPFNINNSILKGPEKDYQKRPRFLKSRISVIFAFNASGDYLSPFVVYPQNFKKELDREMKTNGAESESRENECYSPNGYVTCRVFETWLISSFIPYLTQKKDNIKNYLLLFCGKLSVVDTKNLKLCTNASDSFTIDLFAFNVEQQMPFNFLFQKNLRKRQTDLFLDSWRKCTAKSNLPHQFKCKTRAQFLNLFLNAFQNCIDEIG